jgi:NAD(P)-dependent dehydrogenase (short-subunit alcohol dehydrogenase family)
MTNTLSPPVAIVTGGGQGLGREIALRFAREGVCVVVSDMNAETLAQTLDLAGNTAQMRTITQNVTAEDAPRTAVKLAVESFGRLDWLVNNAGIGNAKAVHETTDADWDRFADINLRSAFRYAREVLPHLESGRGCIVHMASTLGILGSTNNASYAASKAALIGLTRQMAADYGPKGIRTNAVAPGLIETPLTLERLRNNKAFKSLIVDTTPFPRIGRPQDIANAVYFLCSDQASFINGHTLVVDGGWSVANYVPT